MISPRYEGQFSRESDVHLCIFVSVIQLQKQSVENSGLNLDIQFICATES